MTYNVFSGTLNPTHFTSLLAEQLKSLSMLVMNSINDKNDYSRVSEMMPDLGLCIHSPVRPNQQATILFHSTNLTAKGSWLEHTTG